MFRRAFKIMTESHMKRIVNMAPTSSSNMIASSRYISMEATPSRTLMDENVEVHIDGLSPRQPITIRSYFDDEGKQFESHAHYTGSRQGDVSTIAQPSEGGSYTGVEPMGLFWSMVACPEFRRGTRYMKQDVTKPLVVHISVHDGHLDRDQVREDTSPMIATSVERWYMSKDVEAIKVKAGRVRGTLLKPKDYAGSGRYPGVIDMFGGVLPGCNEIRAALLANKGYAALALSYFGGEGQKEWSNVSSLEIEYFEEAADWLRSQHYVQRGGIATIGICKGAEMALAMAVHLPEKIRAVVSISSAGVLSMCPSSYKGELLPSETRLQFQTTVPDSMISPDGTIGLKNFGEIDYSIFQKFDKIRCPLLAMCGDHDAAVCNDHSRKIAEMVNNNGHHNTCELIIYPGAGHLLEPPHAPICTESYQPPFGIVKWGGIPAQHAHAQEDAWKRLLAFLHSNMTVEDQRQRTSKL